MKFSKQEKISILNRMLDYFVSNKYIGTRFGMCHAWVSSSDYSFFRAAYGGGDNDERLAMLGILPTDNPDFKSKWNNDYWYDKDLDNEKTYDIRNAHMWYALMKQVIPEL